MPQITISEEKLHKVLNDVEILIEDVALLLDQDKIAQKRLQELKTQPSLAKSEHELDAYLKKRGVKVE